ncbi:MAG: LD-carboxypeptidase [Myxococcota bacterium]|nr:LD-carboxypeptidase [Myxococcota bacterium]
MPRLKKARALRPGARVGVAAPAARVDAAVLEAGEQLVRELGYEPVRADDPTAECGYFAGDDDRRTRELNALIDAPDIAAILCARGGYGCHRYVDRLDPMRLRAAATLLVGYSDITTLLLWQRRVVGLTGIHGPMLERSGPEHRASMEQLFELMAGGVPSPMHGRGVRSGCVEGPLVGGSLTLVAASLGTPWEIDTRGAILLLEDVNEAPFRIDRMLHSLRVAGKLAGCAGIGVGAMVDCDDARHPDWTADGIIAEQAEAHGLPLVCGLPFGHLSQNRAWTYGARAVLDGDRGTLAQLEAGVSRRS